MVIVQRTPKQWDGSFVFIFCCLLTGWENNETAANAAGEVHDSSGATAVTPIRTRRNGDAAVSNYIISKNQECVKKKSYRENLRKWQA